MTTQPEDREWLIIAAVIALVIGLALLIAALTGAVWQRVPDVWFAPTTL